MMFTQNETKKLKYHINSFFIFFYFGGGVGGKSCWFLNLQIMLAFVLAFV